MPHSEYDDDIQTLVVESVLPVGDCLACAFSVELLLDAIHRGTFQFCRQHMVRAIAYGGELVGEHPLHVVP